jgi:hypothetical protein
VVSKRYLLDAFEANPNIIEPLKWKGVIS